MFNSFKKYLRSWLIYLQKYTKTDMVSLARDSFWLSTGFVIEILGGLLTIILLANLVDKENLGTYQFVISTAAILGSFTLTGLAVTVTTETAKGNGGGLWSGFHTKLKWNIGILFASLLVALYYFINDNTILATAFLIVGALAPFIESFHLYRPFLIGKQAYKFNAALNILRKGVPTIVLITTLFITKNPLTLIAAYFTGHFLAVLLNYTITFRHFNPPRIDVFKDKILFSKHLSIMQLAGRVAEHIDKILVFHYLGAVAVATYTIAQMPTKYTSSALGLLRSLVIPKVSKRDFTTLQHTLPHKVFILFGFVAMTVMAYIAVAPFVFSLVFPEYPESIRISQMLALSILAFPFSVYSHTLTAHEKTTWLYLLKISGTVFKLTLLYTLLPIYGIWGAVYAILASQFINNIFLIIVFTRIK